MPKRKENIGCNLSFSDTLIMQLSFNIGFIVACQDFVGIIMLSAGAL